MNRKLIRRSLFLASLVGFLNIASASANTDTTQVTGTVTSGNLSFTKPSDSSFKIRLNGENQIKTISSIKTIVTDFRGIDEGWQLLVKSANYMSYKSNYHLILNDTDVTNNNIVIVNQKKQSLTQEIVINTKIDVEARARAGDYRSQLDWNLQPNVDKQLVE
ncbi:MAG: hypothetical protein SOI57_03775 [Leuconostoc gelidum]|jgi:hypothetical protein|uniref:hypothetical protein n=1 Tax=Leuconostoc gelidum TaxID=1244 RepID=UPI001575E84A|nr:hypothetical protein [Leuconostoc gelidum]MBZ5979351.1 hypothetical protein [Leuconostoc gelidum subsp. gelidum]MBZ6002236.1 hypothetical protein [Leuconostoc gelidum subsp. gelidum]QDJ30568.1 hypothetical protein BHS02_08015 [Leuconostoc gelidum subsp. gelidum]